MDNIEDIWSAASRTSAASTPATTNSPPTSSQASPLPCHRYSVLALNKSGPYSYCVTSWLFGNRGIVAVAGRYFGPT